MLAPDCALPVYAVLPTETCVDREVWVSDELPGELVADGRLCVLLDCVIKPELDVGAGDTALDAIDDSIEIDSKVVVAELGSYTDPEVSVPGTEAVDPKLPVADPELDPELSPDEDPEVSVTDVGAVDPELPVADAENRD